MRKKFLFVLLFITAFCSAKDFVFLVTDEYTNIFTINGLDYYLEDNSLSIQLGDHFIIKKNEKVSLPDHSYYLVSKLTHVESGVTKNFTSTVMNDNEWATVHEIVIESTGIESNSRTGLSGYEYTYYIPHVTCHVILEDGTTFHVENGSLKDTRSREAAEELLEEFLANLPSTVKVTNEVIMYPSSGIKDVRFDMEWHVGSKYAYRFYVEGQRRKKEKDISDSRLDFYTVNHYPCAECGENARHCLFEKFGYRYTFGFKNHNLAHAECGPTDHYDRVEPYFRLLRIYEDSKYGRVFVMLLLPGNQEYHLFINHDASVK